MPPRPTRSSAEAEGPLRGTRTQDVRARPGIRATARCVGRASGESGLAQRMGGIPFTVSLQISRIPMMPGQQRCASHYYRRHHSSVQIFAPTTFRRVADVRSSRSPPPRSVARNGVRPRHIPRPANAAPTLAGTRPKIVFILADHLDANRDALLGCHAEDQGTHRRSRCDLHQFLRANPSVARRVRNSDRQVRAQHRRTQQRGDTGGWATFVKNGGEKGSMDPRSKPPVTECADRQLHERHRGRLAGHVAPVGTRATSAYTRSSTTHTTTSSTRRCAQALPHRCCELLDRCRRTKSVDCIRQSNARILTSRCSSTSSTAPHLPLPAPERPDNAYSRERCRDLRTTTNRISVTSLRGYGSPGPYGRLSCHSPRSTTGIGWVR